MITQNQPAIPPASNHYHPNQTSNVNSYAPHKELYSPQHFKQSPYQTPTWARLNYPPQTALPERAQQGDMELQKKKSRAKKVSASIRQAIQKIEGIMDLSSNELVEISTLKNFDSVYSRNKTQWCYLEKFHRDYQILIADLKGKKDSLKALLESIAADDEQLTKIENWVEEVNTKYIGQLKRTLKFQEWKLNIDTLTSQVFLLVTQKALKNLDIQRLWESKVGALIKQGTTDGPNIIKSEVTIYQGGLESTLSKLSQSSLNYSASVRENSRKNINVASTGKSQMVVQEKMLTTSQRSSHQFNLMESAQTQKWFLETTPVVEYSDTHTVKSSELRKWGQGIMVKSSSSVYNPDETLTFEPYALGGSYHPMSQSTSSHRGGWAKTSGSRISQRLQVGTAFN